MSNNGYPLTSITRFTATPSQFSDPTGPMSVQLQWATENATAVTIAGIGAVDASGTLAISIFETANLILTAFNAGTQQMASQTLVIPVLPEIAASLVPTNTIIPYSGSVAPAGWVLCDGSDSRAPNLKNFFILGAGNQAVSATGADTHTHTYMAFGASMTTSQDGSHSHLVPSNWSAAKFDNDTGKNYCLNVKSDFSSTPSTESAGTHSHPGVINCLATTSGTAQARPPWYALCYIMKVSQ